MTKIINKTMFESLLRAYWLRPETALWYSAMLTLAKKFGASSLNQKKSLDFGPMDGINSYILLGGRVPIEFDAFYGMEENYCVHSKLTLQDDYYDHVNISDLIFTGSSPEKSFTYGIDWKNSHIQRSQLLRAHENLFLWDKKSSLPIKDSSVDLIWAPNIYWMEDLSSLFKEFSRISSVGSSIITIVPDIKLLEYLILNIDDNFDNSFLKMFDRGRFENAERSARSRDEWVTFFHSKNFKVDRCEGFISPQLISAYEIGFRPMFTPLLHMRRLLSEAGPENLFEVKNAWIRALLDIFDPLIEDDYFAPADSDFLWHMFALVKE
jgi:hypothetical protein